MPRALHEISAIDSMHRVVVFMDNSAIVLKGEWQSWSRPIASVSDGEKTYVATTEYAVGIFGPQHTDESQVFEVSLVQPHRDERISGVQLKFTSVFKRPKIRK